MDMREIESAMEAILFASGEPVHVDRFCVALELDRPTAEQVLQKLMDAYAYERRMLSQPALEVLTIIAYYQPTTRAYVDQIRGVDSAYTIGLLLERKLIEECGRLQVPGRPHLYRTTRNFLRAFHLSSLEDLPEMPDLGGDGQMRLSDSGEILDPAGLTEADLPESAGEAATEE